MASSRSMSTVSLTIMSSIQFLRTDFFAAPKLFYTDAFVILVDTVAACTALAHHEHNGRKIAWWSICLFLCRLEAGRDFLFFFIRSSAFSKIGFLMMTEYRPPS